MIDHHAGCVGCLWRGQKNREIGDLFGLGRAPERHFRQQFRPALTIAELGLGPRVIAVCLPLGAGDAGMDTKHANPEALTFAAKRDGERIQRRVGGRAGGVAGVWIAGRIADDIDDDAVAPASSLRDSLPVAEALPILQAFIEPCLSGLHPHPLG